MEPILAPGYLNAEQEYLMEDDLSNLTWWHDVTVMTCHGKKGNTCHMEMDE
jgi:hypothetical protein